MEPQPQPAWKIVLKVILIVLGVLVVLAFVGLGLLWLTCTK